MYGVTLLSPTVGEPGETVATHAGELRLIPPHLRDTDVVEAATPEDAVQMALTGTITATVGSQSANYAFGPDTAGLSKRDRLPYLVQVSGTEGRVWLEDLAGFPNSDWDYNDRSWRVSVRALNASSGGGGGTFSIQSYPYTVATAESFWYPAMAEGPDEIRLRQTVTQVSDTEYRWDYEFANTSTDSGYPTSFYNLGVGKLEVGVLNPEDIYDHEVPAGWTVYEDEFNAGVYGPAVRWETTSDIIMPGGSRTFTFYTPVRSTTWGPGIGYSPEDPADPGGISAEGAGMIPGGPTGDLDLIDSAGNEVADNKEEDPGGWVPVNNDNDDYDFEGATEEERAKSLKHVYDKDETGQVIGENDLINIRVHRLAPSGDGKFTLNWTSPKIKVWRLSDKNGGQVMSGTEMPVGQTTNLWVEGLSLSTTPFAEEIQLVWTGDNSVVDKVKLTVYEVTGAMNVPGHSLHTYKAVLPGATAAGWAVTNHGDLKHTPPSQTANGYTTNSGVILWHEGAQLGLYRVTAPNGFSVLRQVNVVKIAFASIDNIVQFNDGFVKVPNTDNKVNFQSSTEITRGDPFDPTSKHFMTATLRVATVEGPLEHGQRRGERFIEMGWMQSVFQKHRHADYRALGTNTANIEGKTYNDGAVQGTGWQQQVANDSRSLLRVATDDDPANDNRLFFNVDSPEGQMNGNQRPDGDPEGLFIDPWWKIPLPDGTISDPVFYSWVQEFWTYFGVRTVETTNGADLSFTIRAEVAWALEASGNIEVAYDQNFAFKSLTYNREGPIAVGDTYYRGHNGAAIAKTTQFTEVADGRIFSRTLIEGPTANSIAIRWKESW